VLLRDAGGLTPGANGLQQRGPAGRALGPAAGRRCCHADARRGAALRAQPDPTRAVKKAAGEAQHGLAA
jgi:hypothetical protein